MFVIDIGHEDIAIKGSQEARHPGDRGGRHQLRPGAGGLRHPGNDDAIRAVQLYARAAADAVLEGKAASPNSVRARGKTSPPPSKARKAGPPPPKKAE